MLIPSVTLGEGLTCVPRLAHPVGREVLLRPSVRSSVISVSLEEGMGVSLFRSKPPLKVPQGRPSSASLQGASSTRWSCMPMFPDGDHGGECFLSTP